MRNFIILFTGREGTSPLVRMLDNFDQIEILHQIEDQGWEPFDRHNCGQMKLKDLQECLSIIFGEHPASFEHLNEIYTKTASRSLQSTRPGSKAIGFKMRLKPKTFVKTTPLVDRVLHGVDRMIHRDGSGVFEAQLEDILISTFQKHNVHVFMAVRQDVFRWALSKYHGDGYGNKGHLQFKLALGEMRKSDVPRIHVDPTKFAKIIKGFEQEHSRKRKFMQKLRSMGIKTSPILYEDFLDDKKMLFLQILSLLQIDISPEEVDVVLEKGAYFEKVHSNDVAEFVINHAEIQDCFGSRFVSWK